MFVVNLCTAPGFAQTYNDAYDHSWHLSFEKTRIECLEMQGFGFGSIPSSLGFQGHKSVENSVKSGSRWELAVVHHGFGIVQ